MASLTLKNIPDDLLEKIKEVAERERRSMTQQVLYMLEQALSQDPGIAGESQRDDPEQPATERNADHPAAKRGAGSRDA